MHDDENLLIWCYVIMCLSLMKEVYEQAHKIMDVTASTADRITGIDNQDNRAAEYAIEGFWYAPTSEEWTSASGWS